MRDGRPRGGVAKIEWKGVKPNWVPYVGVKDIDAVVLKAKKLGGKVLIGLDPDREDDVAILADPSGAVFGVQQLGGKMSHGEDPS
jgi:predicted enzyme related to lactoylglutathione lyase